MSADRLTPLALPAGEDAEQWVREHAEAGLARARELVDRLKGAPPGEPLEVLRSWDEITRVLAGVGGVASLLANVHPDEAVRGRSDESLVALDELTTQLGQDRDLHDLVEAVDPSGLDPAAVRLREHTLRDFRRSGVDRDDATRARLAEINARLTTLTQDFDRAIRDDVRSVRVPPERLRGMPEDWLADHPAEDDGLVSVTTDYPDVMPVRSFAEDADLRRELVTAFLDRGYPDNEHRLREMLALRHELATLVGHGGWPAYDAEVKMIGEGSAIPEFIERISAAASGPAARDLQVVLDRLRQDRPDASVVETYDVHHYEELVRKEQLEVDAQQVRRYFDFTRVRDGLLAVTGRLFGLRWEPVPDAPVWHPDVTAYDVYDESSRESSAESSTEGGAGDPAVPAPFARIYLDLHPREGKFKHAAQFTLVKGLAGRQLAEGALVCNFSRGLMEHGHVVTLFHEFGHLVHHVLAGRAEWTRFSGVATEWDFVEAPSQLLEEWAWDADVLASFATDAAGEPIPAELVARMRRAQDFGRGYQARTQMFYAALSYWLHQDRPDDLAAAAERLQERYSPFPYLPGTHFYASFGHLAGYTSAYYTYMWSLVIAKDLFSAFDPEDLFAVDVARRYRDRVLAPGGSRDAADLVEDFLGRPSTFDAYAAWLGE